MKKNLRVIIIIFLILLLAAGIILGILWVIKGKMNPAGSASYSRTITMRSYAYDDQGKMEDQGDTVYYFDSNNALVRKRETILLDQITERMIDTEYDSKGRVVSVKTTEKSLVITTEDSVTTYQYFQDTELITDCVCTEKDGSTSSARHMEYDDEGNLLSEEFLDQHPKKELRIIRYNDKGVRISDELTGENRTISLTEYDANTQTTRNYKKSSDPMWTSLPESEAKTLYSTVTLLPDGRMSKVYEYDKLWVPEAGKYVDAIVGEKEYQYFPEDGTPSPEGSEYAELSYNEQGELTRKFLYDSEGRALEIIEYENGSVKSQSKYDYHASDPDFPGEEIQCHQVFRPDSDGNLCLTEEVRSKNFHREDWAGGDIVLVYHAEEINGEARTTTVECDFYDNGNIRESRTYITDSGETLIRKYDELGNLVEWGSENADGDYSVFEKYEYNY